MVWVGRWLMAGSLHLVPPLCCLQRFHDQPGVQPQWVLPAERRHHFLQPVSLQLHDFQVVLRSLCLAVRGDSRACWTARRALPACLPAGLLATAGSVVQTPLAL